MTSLDWSAVGTLVYGWIITTGLKIVVILIVAFVAARFAGVLVRRVMKSTERGRLDTEAKKRADTLGSVVDNVLTVTISVVALLMILDAGGLDVGPILATAGVLGLAVGFGAQTLVQDVISGFFILLDNQIRVGDVVNVAGKSGFVERVNLRMVVLRDMSGSVHYIRNNKIDVVTNMTQDFSFYVFDIGVAYREDVDEVTAVITSVGAELRADPEYADDILDDIEVLGLDAFADSAVVIKARFKTKPIKQWRVGRAYNRLLKAAFDARGIEIPFPHVTVYMGEDKQGEAPPMHVRLEGAAGGDGSRSAGA